MPDAFWYALFGALPATIAALSALIATLRQGRNIQKIETATNSMKDALIVAAHKQGVADERHAVSLTQSK